MELAPLRHHAQAQAAALLGNHERPRSPNARHEATHPQRKEATTTPEQTDAARKAANYRAAEARINAQIAELEANDPTPADKRFISQQRKLAARNSSRARNWEAAAGGTR